MSKLNVGDTVFVQFFSHFGTPTALEKAAVKKVTPKQADVISGITTYTIKRECEPRTGIHLETTKNVLTTDKDCRKFYSCSKELEQKYQVQETVKLIKEEFDKLKSFDCMIEKYCRKTNNLELAQAQKILTSYQNAVKFLKETVKLLGIKYEEK